MSSSSSSSSSEESNLKRKREKTDSSSHSELDNVDQESELESEDDAVLVVSHAEKRRQKKREKQLTKTAEGSEPKKRKLDNGDTPSSAREKRQNSVWVGNMSFKTTPEALKTFFTGIGEITRIHMPMKVAAGPGGQKENRGFAYVDFETKEGKTAAIAMSEKPLIGRKLLIKDGDDFTGRPANTPADGTGNDTNAPHKPLTGHSKTAQKILRMQKQPPAPTLFLGNLGFEATENSIRELLEAHRSATKQEKTAEVEEKAQTEPKDKDVWIRKVRLGTFEDSGLCKGFAFVDFTSIDNATSALINPKNHLLDGRKLVVEYASADAVRRGGGGPKRPKADGEQKVRGGREARRASDGWEKPKRGMESLHTREEVERDIEAKEVPAQPEYFGKQERGSRGRDGKSRTRPRPGAALALAKRESAAIVPSEGRKIKF